jgi:hypothetical protein
LGSQAVRNSAAHSAVSMADSFRADGRLLDGVGELPTKRQEYCIQSGQGRLHFLPAME